MSVDTESPRPNVADQRPRGVLAAIARLAIGSPWRVIALAALVAIGAGFLGIPVASSLSAGGFQDPGSESARAARVLSDTFHRGDMQLLVTLTSAGGADGPESTALGKEFAARLEATPFVTNVVSAWTTPPQAAAELVSKDGRTGLIVAGVTGGENDAPKHVRELVADFLHDRDGVQVQVGGMSMMYAQINSQTEDDLLIMELIALPVSFIILVWIFGGVIAAALPLVVGVVAILGSMAVLRVLTFFTDVSIFALNLSVAMGLALAIDYTLLIISRYREELDAGADVEDALRTTLCTAGRTVTFSAVTVGLSMSVMVLFPMYFLKSFAYAGVAVVFFAAIAALVITPAAIVLLSTRASGRHHQSTSRFRSDRLDALDVRSFLRRVFRRPEPTPPPVEQMFWYRVAKATMKRAVPIGIAGVVVLGVLGAPFLSIKWGFPDDRVLPESNSARQVGDQLRTDFPSDSASAVTVVLPDVAGVAPAELNAFAMRLSQVPDVANVSAPEGNFVRGVLSGPPAAAAGVSGDSVFMTVGSTAALFSPESAAQLDAIHAVPGPDGRDFDITGSAQMTADGVHAVTTRMPVVLGLIGVITFVLLFMLTGSVVLPLKALILNVLSLTAAFGALVWVFQDGHLGGLGTTATGTLDVSMPVLMFCIAFGLSMDYEVFLIARIREYWLQSGRTTADSDESVALGLARTGRVITAAALLMTISFAALTAAQVSFMRMFGFGLTIAILVDATLVRMILVPAFMSVLGQHNWWAPKPLARFHDRFGISESGGELESTSPGVRPGPDLT